MALSEKQKAENKAAALVKRRAYAQRCRQLRAAVEAAESCPDVLAAKAEADAARQAAQAAWDDRDRRVEELRAQIADIERRIEEVRNERAAFSARETEKAAWARWSALKDAKVAEAEAAFPDLAGHARWSAGAWEPPSTVQEAMDAARASAHGANRGDRNGS